MGREKKGREGRCWGVSGMAFRCEKGGGGRRRGEEEGWVGGVIHKLKQDS